MLVVALPPPPPPALDPPVVDGPELPEPSTDPDTHRPQTSTEFRLPTRKGTGLFGAAAGLFVLGSAGNVAAWQIFLQECYPGDDERGDCFGGVIRYLGVTYGATTVTRGSFALAAMGGDWLGEYRGARDGWFARPARPTRGWMAAGGVAFGAGLALQIAGLLTFSRGIEACDGSEISLYDERSCMERHVWSYVSMLIAGSGLYTVGSGLLGFGHGYKEAHRFWSRRRINVSPSISSQNLGGSFSLRF